jgi:hypothetical protein
MTNFGGRSAGLLLAAAIVPVGAAQAAPCGSAGAKPLAVGTVSGVPAGAARSYSVALKAGESVIVDLALLSTPGTDAADEHDGEADPATPRSLALCDARGTLVAPQPGEVFKKGGSHSTTEDGERLRFVAPADGNYIVSVAGSDAPREILLRRRDAGTVQAAVMPAALGRSVQGIVSSATPVVYSFSGSAGQWVELKVTSDKDTVLRLAEADRDGAYTVVAENDDSDGLNPMLRRKLRTSGTYFLQVDSLSDDAGGFELSLRRVEAPKPAPAPAVLRSGAQVSARLADGDAVTFYTLPVQAGHSYRLDLTAPYDSALAIGLPNPVESEDGSEGPSANFSEVKSQDANLTGTERLNFTARNTGTLLVRVKSFGLNDTNGGYTLIANDLGE